MKKNGVLNKDLSEVIASMGHQDMLIICDAGLPIPLHVPRIDLAVKAGIPSFLDVLQAVEIELCIEKIIVAEETVKVSPAIFQNIQQLYPTSEIQFVSHEEFKKISNKAVAIVRTGECTPYANVILVSGVIF